MSDGLTIEDANMRQVKAEVHNKLLSMCHSYTGPRKVIDANTAEGLVYQVRQDTIREVLEIVDIEQVMCLNCLSGQWICDYDSLKSKIEALLDK